MAVMAVGGIGIREVPASAAIIFLAVALIVGLALVVMVKKKP